MKKLTGKEQKATDHYIEFRKKIDAYKFAYNWKNATPKNVYRRAIEVFDRPHVKAAVEAATARISEKSEIDAAWVLKRLGLLANFNINKFIIVENGSAYYDFSKATDDDWYCISEYTVDEIGTDSNGKYLVDRVKIKTPDKYRGLELIGKHISVKAFQDSLVVQAAVVTSEMDDEKFAEVRRKMLATDDC